MENFRIYITKNKLFLISLTVGIMATLLFTILLTHYLYSPNYQSLSFYMNKLSKINNSYENSIKDNDINIDKATSIIEDNISMLSDLKSNFVANSSNFKRDSDLLNNVSTLIDSTQNFNDYCLSLLSSSESNFSFSAVDLNNKIENLKNNYSLLSSVSNFQFTDDSLLFFNLLTSYINTRVSATKYNSIKQAQIDYYNDGYSKAINDFSSLLQDLKPAVEKIREDNRSLDVILEDLKEKEISFLLVKRNFYSLSIPESLLNLHNSLGEVFNLYDLYLTSMKTAIIYEKSTGSYSDNKESIDLYYNNAYSKLSDVKAALNTLNGSN